LLGAILMFALEPLVGRLLLPGFGGGFQVWTTCLMAFQALLLLGYCYARWIAPRIGRWHFVVILLPLLFLPLGVDPEPDLSNPILAVLESIARYIAVPFGVLTTTSVMAQTWLAESDLVDRDDPYYLYAASNAGSLIGLLGYPLVLEPLLGLRIQAQLWMVAYAVYALLAIVLAVTLRSTTGAQKPVEVSKSPAEPEPKTDPGALAYWFFLSAAPCVLLMAVTNKITVEVGSLPLFWVLPLALYLTTFILAFARRSWLTWWPRLIVVSAVTFGPILYSEAWRTLGVYLLILFSFALACHTELHRRRPDPLRLATFYLVMSLGGFIGGVFVGFIAPTFFDGLYEFRIGIALSIGALSCAWRREVLHWLSERGVVQRLNRCESRVTRIAIVTPIAFVCVVAGLALSVILIGVSRSDGLLTLRNFYGIYRITDDSVGDMGWLGGAPPASVGVRTLIHGNTLHGFEVSVPGGERLATGYYHANSPFGDLFSILPSPKAVGVVGLGAGTMAAHFSPTDELVYYELDPDNERIARSYFGFLESCPAPLRVVVGDARLSLLQDESAPGPYFDAIMVDAFSGDGIPAHLLTVEAISTYLEKLKPGGVLGFHISNRYYDLRPVLNAAADELGLHGMYKRSTRGDGLEDYETPSRVYALSADPISIAPLVESGWSDPNSSDEIADIALWTDDYVNLLVPLYEVFTNDSWN
jgi:SAM-dependent methyltransferase